MSEQSQRTYAICATILIVALFSSWVLRGALAEFNRNFELKRFYQIGSSYDGRIDSTDTYQTLRLNDRQFVIVSQEGNNIEVCRVDANGKVTRTSNTKQ